jgi:hypothetical protein
MFKNFGVMYRGILFIIAIIFVVVYFFMFIVHIGGSIINSIKFGFFTYKTIYIVTDLPPEDEVLKFSIDYISKQIINRYKHKVVSFDECKKDRNCINKVGIIISSEPKLAYIFKKHGLLTPLEQVTQIVKQSGGTVDGEIIVLHGQKDQMYYYAVGDKAPFSSLLSNIPISIMNIIYRPI